MIVLCNRSRQRERKKIEREGNRDWERTKKVVWEKEESWRKLEPEREKSIGEEFFSSLRVDSHKSEMTWKACDVTDVKLPSHKILAIFRMMIWSYKISEKRKYSNSSLFPSLVSQNVKFSLRTGEENILTFFHLIWIRCWTNQLNGCTMFHDHGTMFDVMSFLKA